MKPRYYDTGARMRACARAHHSEDAPGRDDQPGVHADEIDKLGMDFTAIRGGAAGSARSRTELCVLTTTDVNYDLESAVHHDGELSRSDPARLLDRMEVIEFPGYVEEEKLHIARQFLIPRELEQNGLAERGIRFEDNAIRMICREYTYEAGVRNLEREIAKICRKIARGVAENKRVQKRITAESLHKFLGPPQFISPLAEETDEIGMATGLAWTEGGGDIMAIEVTLMPGKGMLMLTGQLGEVMQESAQTALSYTRSQAAQLKIDPEEFERLDIHVHLPEGAILKEGPSAGITLATAMVSAFTQRKVCRDVAMTGEISCARRVLPVGGFGRSPDRASRRREERDAAQAQRERPRGNTEEDTARLKHRWYRIWMRFSLARCRTVNIVTEFVESDASSA